MDDAENDPNGRPSRTRRPRPVSTQASIASGGREREFNGAYNGVPDLSSAVSGVAAASNNATEETEALLRKLRNL